MKWPALQLAARNHRWRRRTSTFLWVGLDTLNGILQVKSKCNQTNKVTGVQLKSIITLFNDFKRWWRVSCVERSWDWWNEWSWWMRPTWPIARDSHPSLSHSSILCLFFVSLLHVFISSFFCLFPHRRNCPLKSVPCNYCFIKCNITTCSQQKSHF